MTKTQEYPTRYIVGFSFVWLLMFLGRLLINESKRWGSGIWGGERWIAPSEFVRLSEGVAREAQR
jgi:hypothetical protein